MLFEAIGRALSWVHLLVWPAFQVTALLGLRGRIRIFSALALVPMALIAVTAYNDLSDPMRVPVLFALVLVPYALLHGSFHQLSQLPLGWIALHLCCPMFAIWNWLCIQHSDATAPQKKKLARRALAGTAVLFGAGVIVNAVAIERGNTELSRQQRAAEVILSGVPPKVQVGAPQGENPEELHARGVHLTLQGASDDLRACYEAGLRVDPDASGYIVVDFAVQPEGRVATATLLRSSGATVVERCIVRHLRALKFAASNVASTFTVRVDLEHPFHPERGSMRLDQARTCRFASIVAGSCSPPSSA